MTLKVSVKFREGKNNSIAKKSQKFCNCMISKDMKVHKYSIARVFSPVFTLQILYLEFTGGRTLKNHVKISRPKFSDTFYSAF